MTTDATVEARLLALEAAVKATDTFYLLYSGALVFMMQAGFGILEAGSVRARNTRNILLKNLLDACIGAIIWWAWGYGTAFHTGTDDTNGFIGTPGRGFFAHGWDEEDESASGADFASWWFQYVFAAAAATIVSGAMAERAQLVAYMVYTTVITGLIYPVIAHWVWDTTGWISGLNKDAFLGGVIDFAGSGVVHMTGGIAAFWGAMIIGPRTGRFDPITGAPQPLAGHSSVLQALGTFLLWFGWYGFNPGSTLAITPAGYAAVAARSTVCTTIAAAAGGLTVVLVTKKASHVWDVGALCNGILGGLVSITAGCATVWPWQALLIGTIGGFVYMGGARLQLKLKIDDPLDAFAVHGCCGCWACLATALFSVPAYSYGAGAGLFFGHGKQLGATVVCLLSEIAWTSSLAILMFLALKHLGLLRISIEMEEAGMDVSKHGGKAYDFDRDDTRFSGDMSMSKQSQSATTKKYKIAPAPKKVEGEPTTDTSTAVEPLSPTGQAP